MSLSLLITYGFSCGVQFLRATYQLRRQVLDTTSDLVCEQDEVLVSEQRVVSNAGCGGGCRHWRLAVVGAVGRTTVAQEVAQVAVRSVLNNHVQRSCSNNHVFIPTVLLVIG